MTWRTRAACLDADPDMFFPGRGDTAKAAQTVCNTCPVQTECLAYACNLKLGYGIWGGLTYNQRRKLWNKPARSRP